MTDRIWKTLEKRKKFKPQIYNSFLFKISNQQILHVVWFSYDHLYIKKILNLCSSALKLHSRFAPFSLSSNR